MAIWKNGEKQNLRFQVVTFLVSGTARFVEKNDAPWKVYQRFGVSECWLTQRKIKKLNMKAKKHVLESPLFLNTFCTYRNSSNRNYKSIVYLLLDETNQMVHYSLDLTKQ